MARLIAAPMAMLVVVALLGAEDGGRKAAPASAGSDADGPGGQGQAQAQADFKAAGVCARCHVVSVLEWGISGHVAAATNCQSCHGASRGHVANERNEVAPDRLPRGAQIAKTCVECHDAGCPKTRQTVSCEKCHHAHALVDPAKKPLAEDERLRELFGRWESFRSKMSDGERLAQLQQWQAAGQAFHEALGLIPGNHPARMRLGFCQRRLNPTVPGFETVGSEFDLQTGLAKQVTVRGLGMPLVLVPAGEFDLGADDLAGSRPVHTVRVEPFYLGKLELRQTEWKAVMGANPSVHQGSGFPQSDQMPVENVSWDDCQVLVRKLNERVPSGGFRLPTEAEWEYACRAGTSRAFEPRSLSGVAWFRENSARSADGNGDPQQADRFAPRPVGTKRPNAWGFYDMQGNVSEWCSSVWRPYLYEVGDGRESAAERGLRVLRGGGFADSAESLDPALRHAERPQRRLRWNGLRLARTVPPADAR